MDDFLGRFTSSNFFNPLDDKVFLVTVTVVDCEGVYEKQIIKTCELVEKIIRLRTGFKNSNYTIESDAVLYLKNPLQYYTTDNSSDIIEWKDKYYRISSEYDRQNNNGYGYRYELTYLNKDSLINGEL